MSRRESRVSMSVRQNDALVEFEAFKKKFLLANKHITKLNSTLSMKIEELNAEIGTLQTENLRLRASEVALASQLKRERAKSRKILSDAEAATAALSAHFVLLRETFGIPLHAPPSPTPTPPRTSPRSSGVNNNAMVNRLSREPQVPDINEEEEEPEDVQHSPPKKSKKKERRLSASRLPLPLRSSTPPPSSLAVPAVAAPELEPPTMHLDLATLTSKKRRQSGLLFDMGVVDLDTLDLEGGVDERENDQAQQRPEKEKERKRRARDELGGATAAAVPTTKPPKTKLKDVTNANAIEARARLPKVPSATSSHAPVAEGVEPPSPPSPPAAARKSFLVAAPPSPPPPEPKLAPVPPELAAPLPSSSGSASSLDSGAASDRPPSAAPSASESETAGRERRARKSVNYTEPKLNTKMRKPQGSDPSAPVPAKRARSSASSAVPAPAGAAPQPVVRRLSPPVGYTRPAEEEDEDEDDGDKEDGEDSDGGCADGEYVPAWAMSPNVNVEGRRPPRRAPRRKGEADVVVGEWARERDGRRHSAAV
ncbi:hypothetical protein FB45DRAFT_939857 [Roridomyces roridus]|uniref:Shugoshin C-terminal domain-containing protein n=1 Tax=Roridomyces roridus TaxID=1738132 RepID=A0AAD7B6Z3_9AGAR|nr:hypothetical protein FB45DRAFT_939857 [Roridomyces roridus]